ncbi:hypothetical protein EVAR_37614_1 [Eumeta japonica]|uniref:Uncharacterized protein n=1 Tax=Eumeta variegata TaxID=151549 RepID=A0A4C1VND1_EUMVA|nr:hypothetical protein EVAR_37614_1 [Eumeta japonica]
MCFFHGFSRRCFTAYPGPNLARAVCACTGTHGERGKNLPPFFRLPGYRKWMGFGEKRWNENHMTIVSSNNDELFYNLTPSVSSSYKIVHVYLWISLVFFFFVETFIDPCRSHDYRIVKHNSLKMIGIEGQGHNYERSAMAIPKDYRHRCSGIYQHGWLNLMRRE